jgi:hypothetical protein
MLLSKYIPTHEDEFSKFLNIKIKKAFIVDGRLEYLSYEHTNSAKVGMKTDS